MTFPRLALTALAVALLAACQTAPQKATPPAAEASSGPAANDNLNAVAWQQTSEEYRLNTLQTYRTAIAQMERALQTPQWDALTKDDRVSPIDGKPPAVIVDIDETVLDNSPYQARLVRDGGVFEDKTWGEWIDEHAAKPVPGALEFAKAADSKGVVVYYVSNRVAASSEMTVRNLREAGFPIADAGQFLGAGAAGCEQAGSDKGCRRKLVGSKYRVLLQIGDQIVDMVSVPKKDPNPGPTPKNALTLRKEAIAPYEQWIGERWFVLANPTYGGWESALFDEDRTLSPEQQRQRKLDALRY